MSFFGMRGMTVARWASVSLFIGFAAGACGFEVPPPAPSQSYQDGMALARALEAGGVACDDPELTHDRRLWEQVACGGTPNKAYEFLLVVFADSAERAEWLEGYSMGCSGPVVYGRNWHVLPADPDALEEVVGAIGGRVVGIKSSDRCSD